MAVYKVSLYDKKYEKIFPNVDIAPSNVGSEFEESERIEITKYYPKSNLLEISDGEQKELIMGRYIGEVNETSNHVNKERYSKYWQRFWENSEGWSENKITFWREIKQKLL